MANLTGESPFLNRILQELNILKSRVTVLEKQVAKLNKTQNQADNTAQLELENNIIFTWAGTTLTISWAAGYVKDKTGIPYPVVAGSRVLAASTVYWAAWNPPQQVMAFTTSLASLQSNPLNLTICSFKTGDAAAAGSAGGGGTEPSGSAPTGRSYTIFP